MTRNDPPQDRPRAQFPTKEELQALVQESVQKALESASIGAERGPDKDWLSNQEVMDYLDVSRSTLRRYRDDGRLAYAKVGQKIYYHVDDVQGLLEENRQ